MAMDISKLLADPMPGITLDQLAGELPGSPPDPFTYQISFQEQFDRAIRRQTRVEGNAMTLREKFRFAKHLLEQKPAQTGGWQLQDCGGVSIEVTGGDGCSSFTTRLTMDDIDTILSGLPA
jgi:hypothetical protein